MTFGRFFDRALIIYYITCSRSKRICFVMFSHITYYFVVWQMQFTSKHYHAWTTMCKMILLSYPPVDDRPSLWDKALNAACVSHITWQLYHRSCDYYCFPVFQGRPYHFAPLMSFWRHDFSPDTNSATDRRSIFRNLFVHSLLNQSYMASLSSFCSFFLLEQTKFLDAELKYLNTFLNWCKIIFDKLKKKFMT